MPPEKWATCNEPIDIDALKGRQCFGGLDLSTTTDISAYVLLFPPVASGEKWKIVPRFFLPEDNVTERVKRDRVPYDVWRDEGLFTLTPGNVIDYAFIRHAITEDAALYQIKEFAYDPYNATEIVTNLTNDGLTMVPFRQGDLSMTPPLKRLMELVLKQEITHGGNPVLAWMSSNVVVRTGPTGLMKPDKEQSREKIDGIVALLDALGRAMLVLLDAEAATFKPFFI
jgi:phage terminase large subunit-like protein